MGKNSFKEMKLFTREERKSRKIPDSFFVFFSAGFSTSLFKKQDKEPKGETVEGPAASPGDRQHAFQRPGGLA